WTFCLPGLAERIEDIEPNLQYELNLYAEKNARQVTFNKEARERYVKFAISAEAEWRSNFRDLNASVTRMATLAPAGRITVEVVETEIQCLLLFWKKSDEHDSILEKTLSREQLQGLDRFDRVQLADALHVCKQSRSLSEAGRRLFSVSRESKKISNDA